ncbi:MAG: helix-turn-helix domain-containing protein [Candidatus Shapirobacteria bacterium]|nr:helix-turn-helix domain-containing protein [Candidatus Shapirobacteria bacterium]MDD5073689.1 helix-turn-helix domain-containing protein [Candidatus Shapirobacteria bacterium]MDD5481451.1 helix-turn-helix domain-containing protein [Candidatus Shapirobacteria bacterium]
MRSVGEILRQEREKLGQDLAGLAEDLKVKLEYLRALEEDDYQAIPGGIPIIVGILSAYSQKLGLDSVKTSAIFRRDYTGTPGSVLPEELQSPKKPWTPTHTISAIIITLTVLAGFFYYSRSFFLSGPPVLKLTSPKENELVVGKEVVVKGKLRRGDVVSVNGEKIILAEDGSFETVVECHFGENLILIEAANPKGEQEQLARRFVCQEE